MSLVHIGRGMSSRAQNRKKIPTPLFEYDVSFGQTITDIPAAQAGSLTEGTVFFSYIDTGAQTGLPAGKFVLNIGNNNWSEGYAIYKEKTNGNMHCVVRSVGGYEVDSILSATTLPNHTVRVAISWKAGRAAFFINGERFVSSTSHAIPTDLIDGVRFGKREGGAFPLIVEPTVTEQRAAFWTQSLSDVQCEELTRLDPLKTFFSQDGSQRVIDTTSEDWVSDIGGFMWAQMTMNNEPTGNEYPLVLDSGNTGNVAGIRLYSGQPYAGYWLRGNAVNLGSTHMASSDIPEVIFGTRQTVGLSWNNITGEAYIYSSGHVKTVGVSSQDITGLTRLNVFARNGSSALDGTLHQFEIGNEYISPDEMEKRIQSKGNRIIIAGAGQSLERGALISQESGSNTGYQSLISTLNQDLAGTEFIYYGDAEGGHLCSRLIAQAMNIGGTRIQTFQEQCSKGFMMIWQPTG